MEFDGSHPLTAGKDYILFSNDRLSRTRNEQGIMIGTARANPGKKVSSPEHLEDPERSAPLKRTYDALRSLEVDALISIGGDDTLKTANKISMFSKADAGGIQEDPGSFIFRRLSTMITTESILHLAFLPL